MTTQRVNINVVPEAKRRATIKSAQTLRTVLYHFQGKKQSLNIKRIPAEYLVYRMANGRTILAQELALKEPGRPPDFFSTGQENDLAQTEQHRILLELSKDTKGDVYSQLKENAEQTQELVATPGGVVINGNRRLAAMRSLFNSNPVKYAQFEHVEVAILTSEDEKDINALEDELQLAVDTKLDYHWVVKYELLHRRISECLGDPAKEAVVMRLWNIKKNKKEQMLNVLNLVNEYREYRGNTAETIDSLEPTEQAFIKLHDQLIKLGVNADNYEAVKKAGFLVISNRTSFKNGRIAYDVIPKLNDIVNTLSQDKNNNTVSEWSDVSSGSTADLEFNEKSSLLKDFISDLPAVSEAATAVEDLVIDTPEKALEVIMDTYDEIKIQESSTIIANRPIKIAEEVNKNLLNIVVSNINPSDSRMRSDLIRILEESEALIKDLLKALNS